MYICKTISCSHITEGDQDYCPKCLDRSAANDEIGFVLQPESSGGDNDYWVAEVTQPKRLPPCKVECEDLIELFQMTFQEGEAFKALWRNGQMRIGNGKPGDSHIRNAQKVKHFGGRMEAMETRALECQH